MSELLSWLLSENMNMRECLKCQKPVPKTRRLFCSYRCMKQTNGAEWKRLNKELNLQQHRESRARHKEKINAKRRRDERIKEYDRIRSAKRRLEKPELVKAYAKAYYQNNRAKVVERVRRNKALNPDKVRAKQKEYTCKLKRQRMESELALLVLRLSSISKSMPATQ